MKRFIAALALLTLSASAIALTPYSYLFYQGSVDGTIYDGHLPTPPNPSANYLFVHDGSTTTVALAPLGTGLSLVGGSLTLTAGSPVNADWTASSGLAQILNKPTLATVATSGSYLDLSNRPTIPSAQVNADWNASSGVAQILNKPAVRSQSAQTRTLNTAFQISATRDTLVTYSVQITVTASIAGGQNGDVILEIASNSGFTTDVQTISIMGSGQTYTLAVAIQGVQPQTGIVSGYVPAGYYARIRTVNNTGTPGYSYRAGQEVFL